MGLGTGSVPTPPPTPPSHHHPFQQEETSDACSSAGTQALFHGQAAPPSHNTQAQVPLLSTSKHLLFISRLVTLAAVCSGAAALPFCEF